MKAKSVTLFAGIALLVPAWIGIFLSGVPRIFAPFPCATIIPAVLLDQSRLGPAVIAIPALLFFVWNPRLFQGHDEIPKRTLVLLPLLAVLDIIWFIYGWKYGLIYQGPVYTYAVCALNVAWVALLGAMVIRNKKTSPSFTANLILHWLLFAWLGWFAFPYLGELP